MKETFKFFSLLLFLFTLTACIDGRKPEKSPGEYPNSRPSRSSPLSKNDSKDPDTVGDYPKEKYPPLKTDSFKHRF